MGLLGGATSLVEMIVKKFGDDIDGATQELVRMGGFPEPVARRIATGELPMDAESVAKRKAEWGGDLEYHGTRANGLLEVDPNRVDLGLHTGPVEQADNRLTQTREWADDVRGETIIPLMVRRGNEMPDMRDIGTWSDSRSVAKEMDNVGYDSYERLEELELDERFYDGDDWLKSPENRAGLDEFRDTLLDDGFDSVRYKNQVENDYGGNSGLRRDIQEQSSVLSAREKELLELGKSRKPENPMPDVEGMSPDEAETAINAWLESDRKIGTDYHGEGFRYLSDAEKAEVKALQLERAKLGNNPDNFAETRSTITLRPENLRSPNAAFDPEYTGPNIMGGLLAGGVGLGALSQSEDADAGFVTKGGKTLLEAWHGSPHKFDRFSMDQIGTGEGAQAYGHGLYFADSEDVARGYRDRLSGDSASMYGGLDIKWDGQEVPEAYREAASYLNDPLVMGEAKTNDAAGLAGVLESIPGYEDSAKWLRDNSDKITATPSGNLYRTEIDVTPESLLDWDKPLSEQSEAVRNAVSDMGYGAGDNNFRITQADNGSYRIVDSDGNVVRRFYKGEHARKQAEDALYDLGVAESGGFGRDIYEAMKHNLGREEASSALSDRGIKGIQYLDGDSRAVGNGTSNYVIFDDSLINIAERGSADPRLLAGTAAGSAGLLAAPMVKDSGMISSPRSETLFDLTMGARDLERRLEGSLGSLLFPSGLVEYLETVNRREEDPNAMTRGMALLDVLPW